MKKGRKYNGLRKSAEQSPVSTMLIVLLLAAGIFLFPVEDMMRLFTGRYGLTEELAGTMAVRYLFAAVIVKLAYDFGFERLYLWSPFGKGALYALPFLLVAINNAPIIGLATGNASVTAGAGDIVLYLFMSLSVGLLEELIFRGIVLPLCMIRLKGKKHALFWSVALSSAIFGGMHLINLLSGNVGGVLLQVGYSFLIGGMCAAATVKAGCVYPAIVLHAVYNAGGLLIGTLGTGTQWDVVTVVVTAVLGVAVFVYAFFTLWKEDGAQLYEKIGFPPEAETINNRDN